MNRTVFQLPEFISHFAIRNAVNKKKTMRFKRPVQSTLYILIYILSKYSTERYSYLSKSVNINSPINDFLVVPLN